jgi:hypothetical protein
LPVLDIDLRENRYDGKIGRTFRQYKHNSRTSGRQMGLRHGTERFSVMQENNEQSETKCSPRIMP